MFFNREYAENGDKEGLNKSVCKIIQALDDSETDLNAIIDTLSHAMNGGTFRIDLMEHYHYDEDDDEDYNSAFGLEWVCSAEIDKSFIHFDLHYRFRPDRKKMDIEWMYVTLYVTDMGHSIPDRERDMPCYIYSETYILPQFAGDRIIKSFANQPEMKEALRREWRFYKEDEDSVLNR